MRSQQNHYPMVPASRQGRGAVQRVDLVGREITVLLPGGPVVFDVPNNCRILLRGEPIKFRIIQPGDQVRITFAQRVGMRVAQSLEVQPETGADCL
jgi:hypothetical protein